MKEQEEPKAEYDVAFDKPSSSPQHRDGSNGASSSQSKAYEEGSMQARTPQLKDSQTKQMPCRLFGQNGSGFWNCSVSLIL